MRGCSTGTVLVTRRLLRGDVADHVDGVTAVAVGGFLRGLAGGGGHPVWGSRDQSVAVRVDGVLVDPVRLVTVQALGTTTRGPSTMYSGDLPVDAVPVDVQLLGGSCRNS